MKIPIGQNFQLNAVYKEHTEFTAFNVNLNGKEACAHFLLSLSHQLDILYAPENCKDRAPWKYMPYRENTKNISFVTLGNVQTRLGIFTVAYSSKSPDNIETLYIYNLYGNHVRYKGELKSMVKTAISLKDETSEYVYQAKASCQIANVSTQEYVGDRFAFKHEDGHFIVRFRINAIDEREAYELALQRLRKFSSFLAVETNLAFLFGDPEHIDINWTGISNKDNCAFFPDYIDSFSIEENIVQISENGYNFLNEHVFTFRDSSSNDVVQAFLAGAEHILEGLEMENKIQENVLAIFPGIVLSAKPVEVKQQSVVTKSLMSYMSALEAATIYEGTHDRCDKCNSELYHISHRIKDIATKYLSEELGKVFSKFYSMRSKYLHAGIFATGRDTVHARPMLDTTTDTGLADVGFISIKFGGRSHLFYVMNVKEWTTYILRCYYQEKLYGRTEFNGWDIDSNTNSVGVIAHYNGIDVKLLTDDPNLELIDFVIQ